MAKQPPKNPAMVLQELTVKNNLAPPEYEVIHSIMGSHENRFDYLVRVAGIEALGTGTSKQISKHGAAHNALLKLEEMGVYDPKENPVVEFKATALQNAAGCIPGSPSNSSLNCIGKLKDICFENKIEDPIFTELSDVGPPHAREFTYECKIGSLKTVATGNTKKMAKQLTAKDMLAKIKNVLPDIILEAPRIDEDQKTLPHSEQDQATLNLYNKLIGSIVVDKKTKVENFGHVFKRLMVFFSRTLDEFLDDLNEKNEDSLTRILDKLELKHEILTFQKEPSIIMYLSINCDVPFATMAWGDSEESIKAELLDTTFEYLDCFFRLEDEC